jgi:hypothetical protein
MASSNASATGTKYYLTELGRRALLTGLKLRELFVLSQLASPVKSHAASG